ncbi:hypothetical protein E2C01_073039 [Portunus trituberculatus]|uniref:Uncharacterized protein n=1 Tax=Portunus trituberculatus TaxID=210409 RepID=A0A5B7HZQ6_PORTR|nr:hypothetical protein [Portunus trituberculatus]
MEPATLQACSLLPEHSHLPTLCQGWLACVPLTVHLDMTSVCFRCSRVLVMHCYVPHNTASMDTVAGVSVAGEEPQ